MSQQPSSYSNPEFDLSSLRIASPCKMNWNEMKGDDRVRHCGSCKLNVYNLAGLSQGEARDILMRSEQGERVCMRLTRRADGTIITKDCPVGVKIIRRARLKLASISASVFSVLFWANSQRLMASIVEDTTMGGIQMIEPSAGGTIGVTPEIELMGEVAHLDDIIVGKIEMPITEPATESISDGDGEMKPYKFEE